jgi:hypothetical protein
MQKTHHWFFISLLVCTPLFTFAQTTLGDGRVAEDNVSSKVSRAHKPTKEKSAKLKRPKVQHTPEYEFYVRIEQVAKQKQRMLRKMDSPQYYNPMYFGHKRPPRRHEAHKMRYCKECGIRH